MNLQKKPLLIGEDMVAKSEESLLPKLNEFLQSLMLKRPGERSRPDTRRPPFIRINKKGCWEWLGGSKNKDGYTTFKVKKQERWLVHRFFFTYFKEEIKPELVIDHLCKNTCCCNPNHLEQVTITENLRRSDAPSGLNFRKTHCPKRHEYNKDNTYVSKTGQRNCKICMRASKIRFRKREKDARESNGKERNFKIGGTDPN